MSSREMVQQQVHELVAETRARVSLVAKATGALWAIEIADALFFSGGLDRFGIAPRTLEGLAGIAAAPFLHGGFAHLIANTIPFAILGFLATSRKRLDFHVVAVGSALVAGLGTWAIGAPNSVHIGASSVVFGFLGFLMGRGYFERRPGAIALSALVTMLFGGMLVGVLPFLQAGISWEGHLFGFIGGVLVSRVLGKAIREKGQRRRR